MSLIDPTKKMSKSDPNPKAYIGILDDLNQIKNKIKGAVTDLDGKVKYDETNKPGISNLMSIYSCITNMSYEEIEAKYDGKGYAEFKTDLAEIVINEIKPIQEKYNTLVNSKELDEILDNGRDYASYIARKKMAKVRNKLGLGRKMK